MDKNFEITCENISKELNKLLNTKAYVLNSKYGTGYTENVGNLTVGEILKRCKLLISAENGTITEEKAKDLIYAINELKELEKEKRNAINSDERARIINDMNNLREYLIKNNAYGNITIDSIIGKRKK